MKQKGEWREFEIIIAIDPGVKTGLAVYKKRHENNDPFNPLTVEEVTIWDAFERLKYYAHFDTLVILEDARKNYRPRGETDERSEARKMGAGWVRTLSAVYELFLKAHKIAYRLQRKGITKINAVQFQQITGIATRTGAHNARDAGLMVWQHPFKVYHESNGY